MGNLRYLPTRIAISIVANNFMTMVQEAFEADAALKEVQAQYPRIEGLLELRIDTLKDPNPDVKGLLDACPERKIIVTPRYDAEASAQGMTEKFGFIGNLNQREQIYKVALSHRKVAHVDIERSTLHYHRGFFEDFLPYTWEKVTPIISYHDFRQTPNAHDIFELADEIDSFGVVVFGRGNHIVKIATLAKSIEDISAINWLKHYRYKGKGIIGVGFGSEESKLTRFNSPSSRFYLTFASLDGRPAVVGQPTVSELVGVWKERGYLNNMNGAE